MHIFYKSKVNLQQDQIRYIKLEDCISQIRSDAIKQIIQEIRHLSDDNQRQGAKRNNLPVVFPSIDQDISDWGDDEHLFPNGVMQFDLDLKDNGSVDIECVKAEIAQDPSTLFIFMSPGGGLKFSKRTDFARLPGETFSELRHRYKVTYILLKNQIERKFKIRLDEALSNIKQAMYLAHDVDAYFNASCKLIEVQQTSLTDYQCQSNEKDVTVLSGTHDLQVDAHSINFVLSLLKFIPPDISYGDALSINYAVLSVLGEDGIEILANHWEGASKTDRSKLTSMLQNLRYSSLGIMIDAARTHVNQIDRNELENFLNSELWQGILEDSQSEPIMPPLMQQDEGIEALRETIRNFFQGKTHMFIKASGGIGKTKAVLEQIINLASEKKVLILAPNYGLAEQMKTDLTNMSKDRIRVKVPKGTNKSCTNSVIKNEYETSNSSIPSLECLYNCTQKDECEYVLSRSQNEQVRIMTHTELYNEPSIWHSGYTKDPSLSKYPNLIDKGLLPLRAGWRPDFIVVDEMAIQTETLSCHFNYTSVCDILNSIASGLNERKSVQNAASLIRSDLDLIEKHERPRFQSLRRSQYLKEQINYLKRQSDRIILNVLHDIACGTTDNLGRLEFDVDNSNISYNRLKPIVSVYRNIPTLYLDATASSTIVNSVYSDIDYREIMVEKRPDIKLKMFSNLNLSRKKLSDKNALQFIASTVNPYIKNSKELALVSYKQLDSNCNFIHDLADELGIPHDKAAHFGALRGLNNLENVSQIFVIGRQWLNQAEYSKHYQAIFGEAATKTGMHKVGQFIRMSNGTTQKIKSTRYVDANLQEIHQHFGASETIQAIMRGRPIHGSPKEIIFFGYNALDWNLEFDEILFDYWRIGLANQIDAIKRQGFIKLSFSALSAFGITRHKFETYQLEIEQYLQSHGAAIHKVCLFKNKRDMRPSHFAIFDFEKTFASWRRDNISVKLIDGMSYEDPLGASLIKASSKLRLPMDNRNKVMDPIFRLNELHHDSDGSLVM